MLYDEMNCFKLVKRNSCISNFCNIDVKIDFLTIRFDSSEFSKNDQAFDSISILEIEYSIRFRYSKSNFRSISIVEIENRIDDKFKDLRCCCSNKYHDKKSTIHFFCQVSSNDIKD